MSESETVAKNRIEFQWRSKLQGTSSEALNHIDAQQIGVYNGKWYVHIFWVAFWNFWFIDVWVFITDENKLVVFGDNYI